MSRAAIVAFGAVSALGEGHAAIAVPAPFEEPRIAVGRDEVLERAGLTRPFAARAPVPSVEGTDRALTLLDHASAGCLEDLHRVLPDFRSLRAGIALGTSSGGMLTSERMFDELREGLCPAPSAKSGQYTYFAGVGRVAEAFGLASAKATLVLGACASSSIAIGLGLAWLEEDAVDLVIAGGYDAVGVLVAAGFEAIRATSKDGVMRPFCAARDGLVLGEGAGLVALVRHGVVGDSAVKGYVRGFGASSDAVHLTAPDRTGSGLGRAARSALDEAGDIGPIGLVSAHGTATEFNDAAEGKAIATALEGRSTGELRDVVVHAFKPQIGHTLGAAGVLESLSCLDAMARGISPATAEAGSATSQGFPRRLSRSEPGQARAALKLSAAFGGANASLVFSSESGPQSASAFVPRKVYLTRAAHIDLEPSLDELEALSGVPMEKLARTCRLSRFALGAVGTLRGNVGALDGAGIVLGHGLATHETNALFWEGIRKRGARFAEPRRFPFTSPNAACGECSIAYRLTGPGFAVGLGEVGGLEALSVAATLVRGGRADRIVVVVADDVGPASRHELEGPSGAVALLVTAAIVPDVVCYELVSAEVTVAPSTSSGISEGPLAPAHASLVTLAKDSPGDSLESGPSRGVFGRVRLARV